MAFTAKDVQALRERTSCGMMDCKKALTEADGDMEKAVAVLREKGLAAASKKAGRIAADGIVCTYTNSDATISAMVEVNSETDFVAKNEEFVKFVENCAKTIVETKPADVDALLGTKLSGHDVSVEEMLREKILVIGENMKIRRFARFEGNTITYVHGGGRIGVMVNFETSNDIAAKPEFKEYAKDVAMQIVATIPMFLNKNEVSDDVIAKEKEILTAQAINEGKPANIAEKMVAGRISKYYKEVCLTEQAFIKDGDLSVIEHTQKVATALGGTITITEFVRYEKGEGIEKKEDNFADEVASMIN